MIESNLRIHNAREPLSGSTKEPKLFNLLVTLLISPDFVCACVRENELTIMKHAVIVWVAERACDNMPTVVVLIF